MSITDETNEIERLKNEIEKLKRRNSVFKITVNYGFKFSKQRQYVHVSNDFNKVIDDLRHNEVGVKELFPDTKILLRKKKDKGDEISLPGIREFIIVDKDKPSKLLAKIKISEYSAANPLVLIK